MGDDIELIVGTYEEFLLGYKVKRSGKNNSMQLMQTFASRDHVGSVRCIDIHKNFIASGGSDDKIFIYDMNRRVLLQLLTCHDGTVNTVAFSPDGNYILSGGADGRVVITKVGSWLVEKVFTAAHKGTAVLCIALHPSGKLALTLGRDLALRTWDLLKGRCVYVSNLKTRSKLGTHIEFVEWSAEGTYFAMYGMTAFEIWSVKTASVLIYKEFPETRPSSLCWINDQELLIGLDNGTVVHGDINECYVETKCNDKRIKAIAHYRDKKVAIISSSGDVSLWEIDVSKELSKICTINTGTRPICMSILDHSKLKYISNDEHIEEANSFAAPKSNTGSQPMRTVEIEQSIDEDDPTPISKTSTPVKKAKKKKKAKKAAETAEVVIPGEEATSNNDLEEEFVSLFNKSKKKKSDKRKLDAQNLTTPEKEEIEPAKKKKQSFYIPLKSENLSAEKSPVDSAKKKRKSKV